MADWSRIALRLSPYQTAREWLRGLSIALGAALFMAFVGAFGSGEAPFSTRLIYWLSLMLLGWVWGVYVTRLFLRAGDRGRHLWWRAAASSLTLALPFAVVVRFATQQMFHATIPWSRFPQLAASVTVVALIITAINILAARQGMTQASARPAPFLDRLPVKLRGAEIWAVQAEDHYLRLHTSKGQDLILMRLSDAVAELEGIEGCQVHRSWWIARDAITDAHRADGRATLILKGGAQAPVSRTHAGRLREMGWI